MSPQRYQLSRAAGYVKPSSAIVVTRPGRWGNPFRADGKTREANAEAVERYRRLLVERPELAEQIRLTFAGRDVACWCPIDWPCHGDVILRVAAGGAP